MKILVLCRGVITSKGWLNVWKHEFLTEKYVFVTIVEQKMQLGPNDYVVEEDIDNEPAGDHEITVGESFHSNPTGVPVNDRFISLANQAIKDIAT